LLLDKPDIHFKISPVKDNQCEIEITSGKLVKNLFIDFPGDHVKLSDNYFDVLPRERTVITVESQLTAEELTNKIKLKSLIDSY